MTDTDGLLRPSQTGLLDPGNNPRASRLYLYNDENHITGIQTEEGVHHYTLDELYRLTAAAYQYNDALEQQAQQGLTTLLDDEHYSYDGVGNRLTDGADANGGPWQYNVNHQLQSRPEDITYSYDANGHTLSKTEGADITTYEYDIAERLSTVKHNGVTQGSYQYDPFGRRVKKTTAAGTVYFHYDDTGLLAEYSASGQLIAEYQYTPGSTWMTNPLFRRDGTSNTVHYYYNGHLGQPLKLFTGSGQVTWAAQWQAFGSLIITTEQVVNNLRFPGQYHDSESGLYHNYHRDYDPRTGRYVQRDPIGIAAGNNFYLYAGAAPISYIDELGLMYRNGNDYRDRPGPNWPGCVKPIWAYGAIVGWKPCDDDDKPPRCDCPPCDSGDERGGSSSSGGSSSGPGSRNNSGEPPQATPSPAPPFNFDEYMDGVIERARQLEDDRARKKKECFKSAIGLEVAGQGFTAVGVSAGAGSTSASWRVVGTKFVPGIGWVSTGMTAGSLGYCMGM